MSIAIVYTLDDDDVIVATEGDWSGIPSPVGRSIWTFVLDRDLQMLYRHLFAEARAGRDIDFVYRCDSPRHRRRIEMTMAMTPEGLMVSSVLVGEELRDEPLAVLAASRGHAQAIRCSICGRFGRAGDWVDILDAATADAWFDTDRPVKVRHGVCPACLAGLRR